MSIYKESAVRKDIRDSIRKYVDRKEQIVTRFPPEPSGYLHIGHCKAFLMNYLLAKMYDGRFIIRMDDTNPEKESSEYETAILEDLALFGIDTENFIRTSNHFDEIYALATRLIREGNAYVDGTLPVQIQDDKKNKRKSRFRDRSIEENLRLWKLMGDSKSSSEVRNSCLRVKLDPSSNNGTLRDPVIYRIVDKAHAVTFKRFRVYPSYDFSCPIVDSLDGVTHVLRSTEFTDRNAQYRCILKLLDMRCPELFEYGKVEFEDAVVSKRKILELISDGKAAGWDDPHLATIRGMLKNGISIDGLYEFAISMGFSKNKIKMSWDKIWSINRKIIDKVARRYICIPAKEKTRIIRVKDHQDDVIEVPYFVRNPDLGKQKLHRTEFVMLLESDIQQLEDGEEFTLMSWGNMIIDKKEMKLTMNPIGNPKDTKHKFLWLPGYPNLITKITLTKTNPELGSDSDTTDYYVSKDIKSLEKNGYIQMMKGVYAKKIHVSDEETYFVEVNDGRIDKN